MARSIIARRMSDQNGLAEDDPELIKGARSHALYAPTKGWIKDTLPGLRDQGWASVRLDGDRYESTMDSLTALYPNLSPGGYLVVDDCFAPACREAVPDYRQEHGVHETIQTIDGTGVDWRRDPYGASP
jgi:hypothetical protein